MLLRIYLAWKEMTAKAFAKKTGISERTVRNMVSCYSPPSLEVAARIVLATEGEVDFMDLLTPAQKARLKRHYTKKAIEAYRWQAEQREARGTTPGPIPTWKTLSEEGWKE